jgi:uncharacterized membrane protein (DUF485 family)
MAHAARDESRAEPGERDEAIDYRRIESSKEFRELVTRRRRFLTAASVFVFGEFAVYLLLNAFAPGFMGSQIVEGLPVAWLAAMVQVVVVTWGVTWIYLRKAEHEFEPLEHAAAAQATARFTRDEAPAAERGAPRTTPTERSAR